MKPEVDKGTLKSRLRGFLRADFAEESVVQFPFKPNGDWYASGVPACPDA